MKPVLKRHTISFRNAFNGLVWALTTQPNYLIHTSLSIAAIAAAFYFHISYFEWLIIVIFIIIGFVVETLNTALEATGDAIDRARREDIRIAKDLAAAAMLIFAMGALIVATIIFAPRILLALNF